MDSAWVLLFGSATTILGIVLGHFLAGRQAREAAQKAIEAQRTLAYDAWVRDYYDRQLQRFIVAVNGRLQQYRDVAVASRIDPNHRRRATLDAIKRLKESDPYADLSWHGLLKEQAGQAVLAVGVAEQRCEAMIRECVASQFENPISVEHETEMTKLLMDAAAGVNKSIPELMRPR